MKAWLARRRRQPEDWEVTETEPLLYLAHSNGSDFLEDERIYSILEQWVDWMPVVKQTQEITPDVGAGGLFPFTWGVMISEAKALRLGIPVNEAVVRIPAGKAFIYHFGGALEPGEVSICPPPDHRVFALMKQHGLRPAGKIYRVVYMYAHMKNRMEQYGIFIVPLTL